MSQIKVWASTGSTRVELWANAKSSGTKDSTRVGLWANARLFKKTLKSTWVKICTNKRLFRNKLGKCRKWIKIIF